MPASPAASATALLQVAGTLGRRLMLGQRKGLLVDKTTLDVNCKVWWGGLLTAGWASYGLLLAPEVRHMMPHCLHQS
jgi:hypothetical protein